MARVSEAFQPDMFDPGRSKAGRDEGITRVVERDPEFKDRAAMYIINLPHGWRGTGEDIRRGYQETSGPSPRHHNAWGGVIMGATRRGVIVKTGERRHMQAIKSHSRTTDVYRRV